jgi:glycerol-3-phosphate acyltransferase PlsY
MDALSIILAAIGGYLLGSIPFGLVLTRIAGLGDIREIGSGNIGATNVLRTGRKDLAVATLVLDASKAGIAALLFTHLPGFSFTAGLVAGAAAFLGHCYPVWLRFEGGKGVATFVGTILAVSWPIGLITIGTWIGIAAIFRISSLAALVAAAATPIAALALGMTEVAAMTLFLALLIYWRHNANIARLIRGEEPRIGDKKKKAEAETASGGGAE